QIFFHREARKDFPALRNVAEAQTRTHVRRRVGDIVAFESNCTGPYPLDAHERLEQCALADAVASEHGGTGSRSDLKADVTERVAAAVIMIQSFDPQHDQRPR